MSLAYVNEESGSTDSRSSPLRTADQETYCCLRELLLHTSLRVPREASDGRLRVLRWKRAVSELAYLKDPTHSIRAIDARAVIGVPKGIERFHIKGCTKSTIHAHGTLVVSPRTPKQNFGMLE